MSSDAHVISIDIFELTSTCSDIAIKVEHYQQVSNWKLYSFVFHVVNIYEISSVTRQMANQMSSNILCFTQKHQMYSLNGNVSHFIWLSNILTPFFYEHWVTVYNNR